jgi:ubiquinone/menaquinone biosynthesis C-methylase UbiE
MMNISTFKESFEFFRSVRYRTNEYYLNGKKLNLMTKKIPTPRIHTFYPEGLVEKDIDLGDDRSRFVVKNKAINRFHPNNIDNKEFWIECRKSFPLAAVCGAECRNIKEVNKMTLGMSNNLGFLPFLKNLLLTPTEDLNLLEIGYGYGSLFLDIKDMCNYYGIDYIKPYTLRKYDNLFEIDKSGIPEFLMKENFFDVVYCVNVLQHCSQQDRFVYFKESYDVLKPNGIFLFTEYLMTEDNKNESFWGVVDKDGRGYTHFFNQLTECDRASELSCVLQDLGFKVVKSNLYENFLSMIVQK